MAKPTVDTIDYQVKYGKMLIELFNIDKRKNLAIYDFGLSDNSKPQKLAVGLTRIPYEDGWQYHIDMCRHSELVEAIKLYSEYGFTEEEHEPFTYLRKNRKALGIHLMIERYIRYNSDIRRGLKKSCDGIDGKGYSIENIKLEKGQFICIDKDRLPYFPTPKSYVGYANTRPINSTHGNARFHKSIYNEYE